jgi:plasmid stabilization system protein ParE
MALKVVWSSRASQKFDEIVSYLLKEWGEKPTQVFIAKVFDFIDILSEFPEIGSIENKEKNIRGFLIVKQVTVFYQIENKRILLLMFFDNRQNPIQKK